MEIERGGVRKNVLLLENKDISGKSQVFEEEIMEVIFGTRERSVMMKITSYREMHFKMIY